MSATQPQPSVEAGYAKLAGAYHSAGEHVDAERWWRTALAGDDSQVGCHVGLARTLAELGRLDEAEGHLRRALALDPLCEEAARIYAELCRWQGRISEAARLFLSALARGAAGAVLLGYAELTWALGAADDAEKHYRRALHHADVSAEACADLGVLLVTRRRPTEAEPHLRRAADMLGCAESLTNHANVLVELGRLDEADMRFRAALAVDPTCAEALWGLAELETQQGHTTSASDLRRRAVDLRPGIAGRCR